MTLPFVNVDIQKELDLAEKAKAEAPPEPVEEPTKPITPEVPVEEPVIEKIEEPKAKTDVTKVVPLAALHEARKESKELRERLKRESTEREAQAKSFQEQINALKAPAPEVPAFETDPAANLKHEVDELKKTTAATAEATQRVAVERQIEARLSTSESAFMKEHSDYTEHAQHIVNVMEKNLQTFGTTDPEAINATIRREIQRLTVAALQAGKEPAELIYEMAKNQGFKSTGKKEAVKPSDKIKSIAEGQESSKSLGSGGRSEKTGALTLESIAKMDDDEFTALVTDDKSWKKLGQLMGG